MSAPIRIEHEGPVATVVIDHPPVNALDSELYSALRAAAESLASDGRVRVVVFESAHEKIFVAGRDIRDMADYERTEIAARTRIETAQGLFTLIEQLPKPTIGVIAGHALGGGCELALTLDFRIMVEGHGRIGQPEIDLGILPGGGGTQRLARLVGPGVATEMLMLGSRLTARQAMDVGLTHRVALDASAARAVGQELAAALAAKPAGALVAAKRVIREGLDGTLADGLGVERQEVSRLLLSDDFSEGVAAFLEKRPARFGEAR